MNKARRKELERAVDLLEQVAEIIEAVKDEEQEAFDNLPESLQCSERGETMESYIDALGEVSDTLSDMQDSINEIIEG